MRLSEFAEKRLINIASGEIMGFAGDCDLLIDQESGRIIEMQLQTGGGFLNRAEKHTIAIPWSAVQKVGPEVIVIDMNGELPRK